MTNLDKQIAQEKEKLKQLRRQKRAQDARDQEKKNALDTRRNIIIGAMVSEYFPEVLRFQPCRTDAENNVEFAPLTRFLAMLAADKQYVDGLKKRVNQQASLTEEDISPLPKAHLHITED